MGKRRKPIVFAIDDPVFKTRPLIIGNCDAETCEQLVRKYFKWVLKRDLQIDIGAAGTVLTLRDHGETRARVVWVRVLNKGAESLGELVHELFHLVVRVCKDKGLPIKANHEDGSVGDEAPAYLLEHYLGSCLKKL